jgi:ABC-type nickel/cobalt efflux system permease component RcnA
MSDMKDIKKRLSMSSTLPVNTPGLLTGSHLHTHQHGPNCGCGHYHQDDDENEE